MVKRHCTPERNGWSKWPIVTSLAGSLAVTGCNVWPVDEDVREQVRNDHVIELPVDCQAGPLAGDTTVNLGDGYKIVSFGSGSRLQMIPRGDHRWLADGSEPVANFPVADMAPTPGGEPIESTYGSMILRVLPLASDQFWVSLHCEGAEQPIAPEIPAVVGVTPTPTP